MEDVGEVLVKNRLLIILWNWLGGINRRMLYMIPGAVCLTWWIAEERGTLGVAEQQDMNFMMMELLHMNIAHDSIALLETRSIYVCRYTSIVFGLVLSMASETF